MNGHGGDISCAVSAERLGPVRKDVCALPVLLAPDLLTAMATSDEPTPAAKDPTGPLAVATIALVQVIGAAAAEDGARAIRAVSTPRT